MSLNIHRTAITGVSSMGWWFENRHVGLYLVEILLDFATVSYDSSRSVNLLSGHGRQRWGQSRAIVLILGP